MITVDLASRLRRAIARNDLALIERILKNNPTYLQNPDFADKSNTSLHLAAQYGYLEVTEYLISQGHDASDTSTAFLYHYSNSNLGISYNTDAHTPLHIASCHSHVDVVELLCKQFPKTVSKRDNEGSTALHLASRAHTIPSALTVTPQAKISSKGPEDTSTIEALIAHGADVHARDNKGSTSLHYASAWGNLKAVRVLIQAGADPMCRNNDGWTPDYYSITVQAEVYYRNLVAEWEKRKAEEAIRMKERKVKGGVRLVNNEDDEEEWKPEDARERANSGGLRTTTKTGSGLGVNLGAGYPWK